jgi:hypothetical protein
MRILAAKMLSLFCGPNLGQAAGAPKAWPVGLNRVLERAELDYAKKHY